MTGWRKQTIMEMAREAGFDSAPNGHVYHPNTCDEHPLDKYLERFAALVRNDERARCISHVYGQAGSDNVAERTVRAIRSGK